jgi:hypothetical protein
LTLCVLGLACTANLSVAQQPAQAASAPASPAHAAPAPAATSDDANDADVEQMRADYRAQRRKVVAANVPLTETEASKFWVVYDQYIADTIKINDGRYALLQEYAKNYQTMTDDQADDFINRWLTLDSDDNRLRLRYIPEFEKVISHRKTALFLQVDRRVAMMVNLQLAGQVPLVKP